MEERIRSLERHIERLQSTVIAMRTEIRDACSDVRARMHELNAEITHTVRDRDALGSLRRGISWKLEFSHVQLRLDQIQDAVTALRTDVTRRFS